MHVVLNRTQPRKRKYKRKSLRQFLLSGMPYNVLFLSPLQLIYVAPILEITSLAIKEAKLRISCFWTFILEEFVYNGNPIISLLYTLNSDTNIYFLSCDLGIYDSNHSSEYHAIYALTAKIQSTLQTEEHGSWDLD